MRILRIAATLGALVALFTPARVFCQPEAASPFDNLRTFSEALSWIEAHHVHDPNQDVLIEGAIRGMVQSLDPHSAYLTRNEYRALTDDVRGAFGGIGVEIQPMSGWLTVMAVYTGAPAEGAGLRAGDRIVQIDGSSARDMRISEAVERVRGQPGTPVVLVVRRDESPEDLEVRVIREVVRIDPVEGTWLPQDVFHLRIRTFSETTAGRFRRVLEKMERRGKVRGLLLDLRNNAGGLLDQAVQVVDEFLARGTIVSTRSRHGKLVDEVHAVATGTRPQWPIVILVNRYTASASEIVAAALRDHGRAMLVGETTFGKGSVQSIMPLEDGSAIKLTVARYYTPRGRSIQARGVAVDLEAHGSREANRRPSSLHESELERHLVKQGGGQPPPALPERYSKAIARSSAIVPPIRPLHGDPVARLGYRVLLAIDSGATP